MAKFAVLGLGYFGTQVALQLAERGQEVLAIDGTESVVERIKSRVASAVCADVTDEEAMRRLDLDEVEAAVVAIGEEQLHAILATAILRKIGVTRIVARSVSPIHARILRLIGANEVVSPEDEMGRQLAERLTTPGYQEVFTFASGRRLVELQVLPDWVGRTLGQIGFRSRLGVNVVAIKREKPVISDSGESEVTEELNDLPAAGDLIEEGDVLLLIASPEEIEKIRREA